MFYVTELHRFGDATNLGLFQPQLNLNSKGEDIFGLSYCVKYVEILEMLHRHELGPMVMCDSNSLVKTLSQYLLSDDKLLVLADTDALPIVDKVTFCSPDGICGCSHELYFKRLIGAISYSVCSVPKGAYSLLPFSKGVRCGLRTLSGNFIAPEQLSVGQENYYDEASDIFKIPDVCSYFLRNVRQSRLRERMLLLFKKCKSANPFARPSASAFLNWLHKLLNEVKKDLPQVR